MRDARARPEKTLDARIVAVLQRAGDDQTAVTLVDVTGETYPAVLDALGRLAAAGIVERSRTRVGSWRITTGQPDAIGEAPLSPPLQPVTPNGGQPTRTPAATSGYTPPSTSQL